MSMIIGFVRPFTWLLIELSKGFLVALEKFTNYFIKEVARICTSSLSYFRSFIIVLKLSYLLITGAKTLFFYKRFSINY